MKKEELIKNLRQAGFIEIKQDVWQSGYTGGSANESGGEYQKIYINKDINYQIVWFTQNYYTNLFDSYILADCKFE